MNPQLRAFTLEDHARARALWEAMDGVGLNGAGSFENICRFLERNTGLSFVGAHVVATILCGHDGRRGLIHHLAVAPSYRRSGLGRALVAKALQSAISSSSMTIRKAALPGSVLALKSGRP